MRSGTRAGRPALWAALLCLAAGSAHAAAAKSYLISADVRAGPVVVGHTTLPAATAALQHKGKRTVHRGPSLCLVTWPRIGLTVNFGLVGNDPRDLCKAGVALVVTITSRGAWRTSTGLLVGDPLVRLRALYPQARAHLHDPGQSGYWLVTRRLCREVGGQPY